MFNMCALINISLPVIAVETITNMHPTCSIRTHSPLTSVAAADHVGEVGESFIAVVALAAAEEDLRVFLHGDTLLPKTTDGASKLLF